MIAMYEVDKKYVGHSVAFRYKGVPITITIHEGLAEYQKEMLVSVNHPAIRKVGKTKKDDK